MLNSSDDPWTASLSDEQFLGSKILGISLLSSSFMTGKKWRAVCLVESCFVLACEDSRLERGLSSQEGEVMNSICVVCEMREAMERGSR
jgi:hypothetical protein